MMELKNQNKLSYRDQCRASAVAYSSLMRWKSRHLKGEAPVQAPGPKKVEPFDLVQCMQQLEQLSHVQRRSHGTCRLWKLLARQISRRRFQGLVQIARQKAKQQRAAALRLMSWHKPGLVWSMDDLLLEHGLDPAGRYVHAVQDLASRFKFDPLVGKQLATGKEVAAHLWRLFAQFGPPLFIKRDNHGNLNHEAVNQVLAEFWVIPLNSPKAYPPYNGAMERAQGELRQALRAKLQDHHEGADLAHLVEKTVHELNHKPRRSLGGRTSCHEFYLGRTQTQHYDRQKRKEVFQAIQALAVKILAAQQHHAQLTAPQVWRLAAQTWLQRNGFITVAENSKCYPVSEKKCLIIRLLGHDHAAARDRAAGQRD